MGLTVRLQARYWGIAAAVFLAVLWALGDALLPFLVGAAMAYFLDPVVARLARLGMSRVVSTLLISALMVAAVVAAVLLIVPVVAAQTIQLAQAAPELLEALHATLTERFPVLVEAEAELRRNSEGLGEAIGAQVPEMLNRLMSSARGIVGAAVFIVIAPVAAVYLLMDWPRVITRIDALLPRDHAPTIRRLAGEIDVALAGFVRGQVSVCLILATYYASALALAGLQFGVAVGVVTGLISFIPYIGAIIGGTLAIGLALFQFWGEWVPIAIIVAIFVAGQIMEGNFLVPKMVGRSVGLHPVWLLLALSVFGALYGFAGLLVAVPVAAALGVLARFGVEQYQASALYRGGGSPDEPPDGGEG